MIVCSTLSVFILFPITRSTYVPFPLEDSHQNAHKKECNHHQEKTNDMIIATRKHIIIKAQNIPINVPSI